MNLHTVYDYSQALAKSSRFTSINVGAALGLDDRTTRRHLTQLLRLGLVVMVQRARGPAGAAVYSPSPALLALYPAYRSALLGTGPVLVPDVEAA